MKKILIFYLILLCFATSYAKRFNKVQQLSSSVKTITATLDGNKYFHRNGDISIAGVRYHDLYFFWIGENVNYNNYNHIFAFSKEGKLIQTISLPKNFDSSGQLFVRNDSLLIRNDYSDYPDYHICLIDTTWTITKINKLSRLIYEDADYRVFYKAMGEWGTYLHFVEQQTNVIHTYYGKESRIIKHKDGYYLYGPYSVSYIHNPKEGIINSSNVLEVPEGNIPYSRSEELIRFKDISNNPFFFKSDSTIAAVTLVKDNILAIINDKKEAFVAEIKGKNIRQLYSIGSSFGSIYGTENFGRNISDSYSSCSFYRSKSQFGILELEDDMVTIFKVNINYFNKKKSRRH